MPHVLVDTNVIVYLYDKDALVRQRTAQSTLSRLLDENAGCVSSQCLSEFANVALKKFRPRFSAEGIRSELVALAQVWPVYEVTPEVVVEAVRGAQYSQ